MAMHWIFLCSHSQFLGRISPTQQQNSLLWRNLIKCLMYNHTTVYHWHFYCCQLLRYSWSLISYSLCSRFLVCKREAEELNMHLTRFLINKPTYSGSTVFWPTICISLTQLAIIAEDSIIMVQGCLPQSLVHFCVQVDFWNSVSWICAIVLKISFSVCFMFLDKNRLRSCICELTTGSIMILRKLVFLLKQSGHYF